MKKMIVRADDLGYSKGINYGIYESVANGIINNVGVMVNMPDTVHGVELIKKMDISFGQHSNISAGYPLSDKNRIPSLVDSNGLFKSSKQYNEAKEDFVVFEEALLEIDAQYNKFLELFNKKPDYLEGHAIASNTFFDALEYFAKKMGLVYSGLPKGTGPNKISSEDSVEIKNQKVFLTMESMQPNYEPLSIFKNLVEKTRQDGIDMMIFHPGYLDNYIMNHSSLLAARTMEVDMLISEDTKKLIKEYGVTLIEFKNL